jgi:hypothetical protein
MLVSKSRVGKLKTGQTTYLSQIINTLTLYFLLNLFVIDLRMMFLHVNKLFIY